MAPCSRTFHNSESTFHHHHTHTPVPLLGAAGKILRASLNGADLETIVTEGPSAPYGLTVDTSTSPKTLYVSDNTGKIWRGLIPSQLDEDAVITMEDLGIVANGPMGITVMQ